jgi:hypothetical protein
MVNTLPSAAPSGLRDIQEPGKTADIDGITVDGADPSIDSGLFTSHAKLISWVSSNGGYLDSAVRIAHSTGRGYHIVAAPGHTVTSNTRITACPMSCSMSVLNAMNVAPFSSRCEKDFPQQFLNSNVADPEMLSTFFLMEQKVLGDKSWWVSYIETLPSIEDINALQFESDDDREWLRGTNLEAGWQDLTEKWRVKYEKGLKQLQTLGWESAVDGSYVW